jgi:glucosamine--fructose-6-phosphate aminotransferase (isomerizing)
MDEYLNEIREEPEALADALTYYRSDVGEAILSKISEQYKRADFNRIIFTGMGSSYFTALLGASLLRNAGFSAYAINSSELLHYQLPVLNEKTLLICISQSGESYEIKELLEKITGGVTCWSITNSPAGLIAEMADNVLLLNAGREAMASTKTYVCSILVCLILDWVLMNQWNDSKIKEIDSVISDVSKIVADEGEWAQSISDFLGEVNFLEIIGRGPSYISALQAALMFKEVAKIPAEGILGGEFRHGPIEIVREGFKAILFAPEGKNYQQGINLTEDIVRFDGQVVLVTNKRLPFKSRNVLEVRVPHCNEYLFPIPSVIPLQLAADRWAKERGLTPGIFTKGGKITIIE